jgi:hypothetical protein
MPLLKQVFTQHCKSYTYLFLKKSLNNIVTTRWLKPAYCNKKIEWRVALEGYCMYIHVCLVLAAHTI